MGAKSVAEKLAIKPGMTVWVSERERVSLIEPLPDRVVPSESLSEANVGILFADDEASLRTVLATCGNRLLEPATIWVAYPKANRTDLNRDTLWPIVSEFGLRPNGQVAIDDVWSALRFRVSKEGEDPFTGGKAR